MKTNKSPVAPVISVITPSLNCQPYLPRNVDSVRRQSLPRGMTLEHWIIDGGSNDGTVEWLREQRDLLWVSEKDRGLSDAVNKGIQRSRGNWIIWLNADDHLAPDACRIVLEQAAAKPAVKLFSGDLVILGYDGEFEQRIPGRAYSLKELLGTRVGLNQPSLVVHREVFERTGLLDVENRYTMDYEWLVRALHHYHCDPVPQVLAYYQRRRGSITDAHMVRQFHDFLRIRRRYGCPVFSWAECQIRFYIATEPLRRVGWLRRLVRRIKGCFGRPPLHPMPQ